MLPCPFYLETDCKFSDDQCRYSHGEKVPFSSLQEYIEPKFESLSIGSTVLAKQQNKLWCRATLTSLQDDKCVARFESNHKDLELELHDILPLENGENEDKQSLDESDMEDDDREDIINMSLMNTPSDQALGNWEQYTKVQSFILYCLKI